MALYRIKDQAPDIHPTAYVSESAEIIGRVSLGSGSSVWSQATLRGDNELITVGERSNVQESAVLHTDVGFPLTIGADVTVGHQVMLHGCVIGDGALIGIQAVVLNGAMIGKECLVGAGSLVTEGKVFEDGWLILGRPAKAVRPLTDAEKTRMRLGTDLYVKRSAQYKIDLVRIDVPTK
jgi:carbonic anhydrase/acetyltransferase-like protein (isoleucine patch superfamily)